MNKFDIERYVTDYLQATQCQIIERSPAHVRVRLSVEADKALTGRPYYWSFVERTGAPPETMTFVFVFDPENYNPAGPAGLNGRPAQQLNPPQQTNPLQQANGESILSRYLGVTPPPVRREPVETITFGCSRLQQIFADVKKRGRFVVLYEQDNPGGDYAPWLCVNFKVEFTCDLKREEIHSLGISLATGEIIESFHEQVRNLALTPKIPEQARLIKNIPLYQAAVDLEKDVEKKLIACDHGWADEAMERFHDEYRRIESFYNDMLNRAEPSEQDAIRAEMETKIREIEWQFRPRVHVSVINCGIFHLRPDSFRQRNRTRADTF